MIIILSYYHIIIVIIIIITLVKLPLVKKLYLPSGGSIGFCNKMPKCVTHKVLQEF